MRSFWIITMLCALASPASALPWGLDGRLTLGMDQNDGEHAVTYGSKAKDAALSLHRGYTLVEGSLYWDWTASATANYRSSEEYGDLNLNTQTYRFQLGFDF